MYKLYGGIIRRFFELKERYFRLWFDYCKFQRAVSKRCLGTALLIIYSTGISRIVNELGWQTISKEGFRPLRTVSMGTTFSGLAKLFSSSGFAELKVICVPSGFTDFTLARLMEVFHGVFSPFTSLITTSFLSLSKPETA